MKSARYITPRGHANLKPQSQLEYDNKEVDDVYMYMYCGLIKHEEDKTKKNASKHSKGGQIVF